MAAQAVTVPDAAERDPGRWKALVALIVAVLAAVFDGALMGLIAPAVASDLDADAATIGLIASITTLMMAAFILGGGTLGDIYGRKRFLVYGIIGLFAASLLSMVTPTAGLLIPVRALSGVMAALINPLTLAIITVTFDEDERPKALGIYYAAIGVVGGLGTIVIQLLNQQFGWRASFLLTIGLTIVAFVLVGRYVGESRAGGDKRVDWIGILLTAGGLFSLVYGINQAAVEGFTSSAVLVPASIGVVVLTALVVYSGRIEHPALQLSLFRQPVFAVGVFLFLLLGFAQMGSFFQLSNYLQSLQAVSPTSAAVTLLPMTLAMFVFAILAGRWVGKISNRVLIPGGFGMMTVGLLLMALLLSPTAGLAVFLVPMVLLGAGYSIANTPRVSAVLASAPRALAGAASATNNASYQVGASLGIAAMGALFQGFARTSYVDELSDQGLDDATIDRTVEVLEEWLDDNAGNVASRFGIDVEQLDAIIVNYESAYTTGVSQVLVVGAVVTVVGAVLGWFTFRGSPSPTRTESD